MRRMIREMREKAERYETKLHKYGALMVLDDAELAELRQRAKMQRSRLRNNEEGLEEVGLWVQRKLGSVHGVYSQAVKHCV